MESDSRGNWSDQDRTYQAFGTDEELLEGEHLDTPGATEGGTSDGSPEEEFTQGQPLDTPGSTLHQSPDDSEEGGPGRGSFDTPGSTMAQYSSPAPPPRGRMRRGSSPSLSYDAEDSLPVDEDGVAFRKFRILRKLGSGGMGAVWLVEHLVLKSELALKVIKSEVAENPINLDRFLREARILARLNEHPNAVPVYDANIEGKFAYIAMTYLRGETLKQRLDDIGRMEPRDVAWFLDEFCSILAAAHQLRIVHRDIKPHNIMIVPDPTSARGERVKALDFGIAKIIKDTALDTASQSLQTVGHVGTYPYSSPEQLGLPLPGRREAAPIDLRSDIYSLGVVLYEMLVGIRPFSGVATKILYDHVHTPPRRFADVAPTVEVPAAVEAVVRRCLEKDPAERPQSVLELLKDFREAVEIDPDTSPIPGREAMSDEETQIALPPLSEELASEIQGDIPSGVEAAVRRQEKAPAKQSQAAWTDGCAFRDAVAFLRMPLTIPRNLPNRWAVILALGMFGFLVMGWVLFYSRGGPGTSKPGTFIDVTAPLTQELSKPTSTSSTDVAANTVRVKEIFRSHCFECHGGSKTNGGVKVLDRDLLVKLGKVVPEKPDESPLSLLITAEDDKGMPPPDQPRLSSEEIELVQAWIVEGASPFPADLPVPTEPSKDSGLQAIVGVDYVLKAILQDVRSLKPEERRSARYFSLTHLLTGGATAEEARPSPRRAHQDDQPLDLGAGDGRASTDRPIEDGLPSQHSRPRLGSSAVQDRPAKNEEPAEPSFVNLFDLVLLEYPYGMIHQSSETFDRLASEFLAPARQVRPLPYIRADWFVSVATQPPLYEDLLELPFNLKVLEKRLGVDAQADLDNARARRAGLVFSGVSRNNRALERHRARYGAYWKSFDFRSSADSENLFRDPLQLNPAGGEVIFTLPNGLQGYFLCDAKGNRLESAPTEIVTDKFAADQVVRNGLSCIRCHDTGMKGFTDAVRPAVIPLPDSPGFDKARVCAFMPSRPRWTRS